MGSGVGSGVGVGEGVGVGVGVGFGVVTGFTVAAGSAVAAGLAAFLAPQPQSAVQISNAVTITNSILFLIIASLPFRSILFNCFWGEAVPIAVSAAFAGVLGKALRVPCSRDDSIEIGMPQSRDVVGIAVSAS